MLRMPDRCSTYNRIINILKVPITRMGFLQQVHIAFLQLSIPSKVDLPKSDTCFPKTPAYARVRL